MSERNKHLFQFTAGHISEAAQAEAEYHSARIEWRNYPPDKPKGEAVQSNQCRAGVRSCSAPSPVIREDGNA